MGRKTRGNLYEAFVGEAKAHIRLLAFARKSEEEGHGQIARLFQSIAAAEEVHAASHLRALGEAIVSSTEANLAFSFDRETAISEVRCPRFIMEPGRKEGSGRPCPSGTSRTWRKGTPDCTRGPMQHLLRDEVTDYYVCGVCGCTSDAVLPKACPICGARAAAFRKIDYPIFVARWRLEQYWRGAK